MVKHVVRAIFSIALLALLGVPAYAQKKAAAAEPKAPAKQAQREEKPALKNAPSEREITRALDRVNKYMSDRTGREGRRLGGSPDRTEAHAGREQISAGNSGHAPLPRCADGSL